MNGMFATLDHVLASLHAMFYADRSAHSFAKAYDGIRVDCGGGVGDNEFEADDDFDDDADADNDADPDVDVDDNYHEQCLGPVRVRVLL
jgi:hypothetical protein